MNATIHPNAIVETKQIGAGTRIWAFVHILGDVSIGENCNVCDHCFIEGGVTIGNNVTIKSGVNIWTGVTIEDDVHIGPCVVFSNDLRPRSKQSFEIGKVTIRKGASIGANTTLLAGIEVGTYAMTGIASVITKNVKSHALVYGNPARQHGWVDEEGNKLVKKDEHTWASKSGTLYKETPHGLIKM
jgi:serine acetyltransferase